MIQKGFIFGFSRYVNIPIHFKMNNKLEVCLNQAIVFINAQEIQQYQF